MGRKPDGVSGIPVKTSAHMVMDSAGHHFTKGKIDHIKNLIILGSLIMSH